MTDLKPTDPAELLASYKEQGYNILTPSISLEGLSPHHRATIETVDLSPDPDYGDVYPEGHKDQFIITKQGLDKLSVLAGVIWHETAGSRRIDDGKKRDYIAFEAFGAISKADGQLVPVKAFYDMDLKVWEEDLNYTYREKASKGQYKKTGTDLEEYVTYCVGRDMRSIRKHMATRCESGARNRVIRAILGLKKKYSKVELQKPFVCVRVTYQPDYEDPEVKRLLTLKALGAQVSLFGSNQEQLPAPGSVPMTNGDIVEADEVEDEETPNTGQNGVDDEPVDDIPDNEFALWDRGSQLTFLEKVSKRKGYDLAGLYARLKTKTGLDSVSDVNILAIYDKLNTMPDVPIDDDIPF